MCSVFWQDLEEGSGDGDSTTPGDLEASGYFTVSQRNNTDLKLLTASWFYLLNHKRNYLLITNDLVQSSFHKELQSNFNESFISKTI